MPVLSVMQYEIFVQNVQKKWFQCIFSAILVFYRDCVHRQDNGDMNSSHWSVPTIETGLHEE